MSRYERDQELLMKALDEELETGERQELEERLASRPELRRELGPGRAQEQADERQEEERHGADDRDEDPGRETPQPVRLAGPACPVRAGAHGAENP